MAILRPFAAEPDVPAALNRPVPIYSPRIRPPVPAPRIRRLLLAVLALIAALLVPAETARSGAVTLTIRPEHVRLTPPEEAGAIPATLRDAVYFGTDTHYHLTLPDGVPLVARAQSGVDGVSAMTPGAAVGLRFIPGAAHVLED